jgi:hypothetical protein
MLSALMSRLTRPELTLFTSTVTAFDCAGAFPATPKLLSSPTTINAIPDMM